MQQLHGIAELAARKLLIRDVLADIGWGAWLGMSALDDRALSTMIVKLSASVCFLTSSLILYPEVNWPCVAMQLLMLAINLRRTLGMVVLLQSPKQHVF